MSTEHDVAHLVTEYLEQVWNKGDLDAAGKFLAPDLIQHNPNLPDGSAPLIEFIRGLREQLPGMHFDIRRVIAGEDHGVVHSLFTTGNPGQESAVVDIFRVDGGRIVEHWDAREDIPAQTASGHPIV